LSVSYGICGGGLEAVGDTLQAAGAEDKPMLGSKLSADSGAKTRLGFRAKLDPSIEFIPGIGISAINPRGSGDSVPRRNVLSLLSTRFVHYSASWASRLAALTRALTKELVAAGPCGSR